MPALGQLKARRSHEAMRTARRIMMTRNVRRRGIYDTLEQDYKLYRIYKTLYAYQMPKQMLKTAATVCSAWLR